jgi:hypothetical protein
VTSLALERFIRIVLGVDATENDTLHSLLEKAIGKKLIKLPYAVQSDGIKKVTNVRNTLLHGNYEQAARGAGCSYIFEYFRKDFASEIERMFEVLEYVMKQIDQKTGKREIKPIRLDFISDLTYQYFDESP